MNLRHLILSASFVFGAVAAASADNVVSMNKLTRQFSVTTNVYDAGTAGGKTYTDLAVLSVGSTAAIDPGETTLGYSITASSFKGLPWNSAFQQIQPSLWSATPVNSAVSLRFFIDLSTPIGKAMYANLLMGMETRGLLSVSIDHSSWISGVGYKVVQLIVEQ